MLEATLGFGWKKPNNRRLLYLLSLSPKLVFRIGRTCLGHLDSAPVLLIEIATAVTV